MLSSLTFSLKWKKLIQEYAGREILHVQGRSERMFTFMFPFIEKIGCKSIFDWKVIRIPLSMHRSGTDTSTFTKLVILRKTNIQITIYLDDMVLRTKQWKV